MKKILVLVALLVLSTGVANAQYGGIKDQNLSPELYRSVHDGLSVYNATGSAITAGQLVYVCGWLETTTAGAAYQRPKVCLADNEAHEAGYVVRYAIANATLGEVFKSYRFTAQNTTGRTVGDAAYLSSTAGGWTATKPTSGIVQIVGRVAVVSSTVGVVEVNVEADAASASTVLSYKDSFKSDVVCVQNDGTACSGADTEVNLLTDGILVVNQSNIGTQTITKPVFSADGLEIGLDKTVTEGSEYNLGITERSPGACVVGTDACYILATFKITTVAGLTELAVGFRNDGAYAPAIDNYTDMAVLNVNAGTINIETIDDNAATTTTDTTNDWADGETHTLGVYISAARAVTYRLDGAAPTTVAAFSVDAGDVIVPFIYQIQSATTTAVYLQYLEGGRQ